MGQRQRRGSAPCGRPASWHQVIIACIAPLRLKRASGAPPHQRFPPCESRLKNASLKLHFPMQHLHGLNCEGRKE